MNLPLNVQSPIWKEVAELDAAQRLAFMETLTGFLGYSEDYYEGWSVHPPTFALEILEATEEQLQQAWLIGLKMREPL